MRLRHSLTALAAFLLVPLAAAQTFTTTLSGANEVPPVTTAATGSLTATLDGTTLVVSGSFSGLESDYASTIGTHLHGGSATENGPVVVPLVVDLDADNRGGTLEAASNTYTVRETFADSIRAGLVYANVHSTDNQMGEVRGQFREAADLSMVTINEVDSDTPGTDTAEFVELYNGGSDAVALDDAVLVLYNGNDDASYQAIDLDGLSIDAGGYLVIGNPGVANVDLEVAPGGSGFFQNGPDAVALYTGAAADFPTDTPITTDNLIDAVVYGTADDDDTDLLAALGETVQQDEDANGDKDNESIQRSPDGSETFVVAAPSPGAANGSSGGMTARLQVIHNYPFIAGDTVDVYVNGDLFLDDFAFRAATPFVDVPAGTDLTVDVTLGDDADNSSPLFSETYNLEAGSATQLIASDEEIGEDTGSNAVTLLVATDALEAAADASTVALRFVRGAPDSFSVVDLSLEGEVVFEDVDYLGVTDYQAVAPIRTLFEVTSEVNPGEGDVFVFTSTTDLDDDAGRAATVLSSGFFLEVPGEEAERPRYRLVAVFADGTTEILTPLPNQTSSEDDPTAGLRLEVENPIASDATVSFETAAAGPATVVLYDALGRRAATLVDGPVGASEQTVALEVGGLAAGVYVLRLETATGAISRTVTVIR
ncbi:CHRD domain-containing protein [Rubrivirga sp.]|uniref:CHRD domain-containing protein n=1 Tax=Rubrivirga sp. TaxID=1885344 RepID=UPI003C71CEC1